MKKATPEATKTLKPEDVLADRNRKLIDMGIGGGPLTFANCPSTVYLQDGSYARLDAKDVDIRNPKSFRPLPDQPKPCTSLPCIVTVIPLPKTLTEMRTAFDKMIRELLPQVYIERKSVVSIRQSVRAEKRTGPTPGAAWRKKKVAWVRRAYKGLRANGETQLEAVEEIVKQLTRQQKIYDDGHPDGPPQKMNWTAKTVAGLIGIKLPRKEFIQTYPTSVNI